MDGKPILLDKFRHQTKHSYSFAIALSTGSSGPEAVCHSKSTPFLRRQPVFKLRSLINDKNGYR